MAMPNIHPIAPQTPKRTSVLLAAANTARDGTGTINTTVATAGAQGAVVPSIRARSGVAAGASSSPMVCRLWHQINGTGSFFLIDEIALPLVAPTGTAAVAATPFNLTNIALGAGDKLLVTQSIAEAVVYTADQGDY
jgi:hypothetical protein